MSPLRRAAGWQWLAAAWLVPLAALPLLDPRQRTWLIGAVSVAAALLVLAGVRAGQPVHRRVWLLVSATLATVGVGESLQAAGAPNAAVQVFFLVAYTPVGVAFWLICRGGPRPSLHNRVDVSIVLVAVATLDWQFLISPHHSGAPQVLVAAVQPGLDLVVLGMVLRLLTGRFHQTPALWLVVGATASIFCGDLAGALLAAAHRYHPGGWPAVFNVLFAACVSIAALHPSMRSFGTIGPERVSANGSSLLVLLPVGAVVPGLMIADAAGVVHLSPAAGAVASLLLFGLAMTRAILAVRGSQQLASVDQLTGLPNRRAFYDALSDLVQRPEAADAVAGFLDLDDFKAINDTYGHAVGDALIRQVSARLRDSLLPGELVARLGGDEFGLLLRRVDGPEEASRLVSTITAWLAEPFLVAGQRLQAKVSAGLVTGLAGADPEQVMSDADVAMYTAKRRGSGGVALFAPPMRDELLGTKRLMTDLREALLSTDGGGLWVAYQPVVELQTGALHGVEALVRWEHPTRGALFPDTFLPAAEEEGLGFLIDMFVLRRTAEQLRMWSEWHPELAGLRAGINLSVGSLRHRDLDRFVLAELERSCVSPKRLTIEITEHEALGADSAADRALIRLAEHGVRIALDDFGTGYTSATYFERFPVHSVKLDRSVIATVGGGRPSAVVRGLAAFAGSLGLLVLAEGVETADQLQSLRGTGFVLAQGWLFAKAGPPEEIVAYADRHGLAPAELVSAEQPAARTPIRAVR